MPQELVLPERMAALLPVPYVSQLGPGASQYNNDCGAASGAMLIGAYAHEDVTPDEFYEATGQTTDAYLSAGQLRRVLERYGIATEWQVGVKLADLFAMLAEERPPIVLFNYGAFRERVTTENKTFSGGHFAVIMGIDTANVYVHDPLWNGQGGAALTVPHDDWLYAWGASVRDGNPANGAVVPTTPISEFSPTEALYRVRVTSPDGLRVRTSPTVAQGNHTGRYVAHGDLLSIWAEQQDSSGNDWGAITSDLGQWIAMIYNGESLVERF